MSSVCTSNQLQYHLSRRSVRASTFLFMKGQNMDYPRCRIYREFFRTLMADRDICTSGSSYLFYYMTLCSYANFRSSYRRKRTTAFHRRQLAFQIRTSAASSEKSPKSLRRKGFPVVNAPEHNISYIPYPTAGIVNTDILYSLAARIRMSGITLNLPCSHWKQRKPYNHI